MITSGEVGARFVVVDEASPVLKKLMEQFKALQGIVDKTKLAMKDLVLPPTVESSIGAAATKMAAMGESSAAVAANFGKMDAAINEAVAAAGRGAEAMAAMAKSSAAFSGGGNGSLRRRASGAASLPGSYSSKHGGGGVTMGSPRLPGHMHAHGFMVPAAVAGFGLYEMFEHGAELSAVQENMLNAGWSQPDIDAATKQAYSLGAKYGQPVADVLEGTSEIRAPLGSATEAMAHMDTLAASMVLLRAQGKKANGGGDMSRQLYDLTRSAEFRNAISGPDFDKAVESIVKVDQATAGRVDPSQFLKMVKYMRAALPGMSDDFLYTVAPEFAQEFGGAGAGTAMSAVYQQLNAGQMRTMGLRLLDQLGEVDESKVDFDKLGRIVKARPGYEKLGGLAKSDPVAYASALIADMDKLGVTDESTQRDWISMIFGNRNSSQMEMTDAFQQARLKRGQNVIKGVHPLERSAAELLANNPQTGSNSLGAALGNLLTAAGQAFTPASLLTMKAFTNLFNNMRETEWSKIGVHADPGAFGSHFSRWLNGDAASSFHVDSYANASAWDHHSLFWMQERNAAQSANWQAGYRGKDLDSEMGREHSRGMALGNMPAPTVNSNVKVDVKVNLDGRSIAAGVEKYITIENRTSNSSSGHDGSAGETYPDHGYH